MKKILMFGAIVSCIIGLFLIFADLQVIFQESPDFFRDSRNLYFLFFEAIFISFAFVPIIITILRWKKEDSRLRSIFVGLVELIVIGLTLAAFLLPAL
ncbi:MAG TPA: hypothetical protein VHG71_03345 [Verrucomicrobiae bacterium]|nr:hypothetical protein [Verrucomicrobiae bacterium]